MIILHFQWITQLVSLILVHWTVIYPVDSAIKLTNNRRTYRLHSVDYFGSLDYLNLCLLGSGEGNY